MIESGPWVTKFLKARPAFPDRYMSDMIIKPYYYRFINSNPGKTADKIGSKCVFDSIKHIMSMKYYYFDTIKVHESKILLLQRA
ncbi:MAG: hypothetical protein WCF03_02540 [Nitrososphaeraceae archaeon]